MSSCDVKEGFCKGEGRVYDDVDSHQGERGIDFSPLKVVLRADLNRGWGGEAK